jgi:hypothetical protein
MNNVMNRNLEVLGSDNYQHWAFMMEQWLDVNGVWESTVIQPRPPAPGEAPDPVTDAYKNRVDAENAWKINDRKFFRIVALHIDRDNAARLHDISSGHEAWEKLKAFHLADTVANQMRISKKLMNMKLDRNGDMRKHLSDMQKMFNLLSDINKPFAEEVKVTLTLNSVESEYEALVTAIEAWPAERLTLSTIAERLTQEYDKKKERNESAYIHHGYKHSAISRRSCGNKWLKHIAKAVCEKV